MRKPLGIFALKYYGRNSGAIRFRLSFSAVVLLSLTLLLIPINWICGWLVAVVIHELGHYIALKLLHVPVREVNFSGRGIQMVTGPMTTLQELISAAAGPVCGILLLGFSRWFPRVALCSLLQSIFNLLPFYPMDGGRILKVLVSVVFSSKHGCVKFPCKAEEQIVQ